MTWNKIHRFIQRCTGVENPGDGVAQIFVEIMGGGGEGVKAFRTISLGGSPFLFFLYFFNKSFDIDWEGPKPTTLFPLTPPPWMY